MKLLQLKNWATYIENSWNDCDSETADRHGQSKNSNPKALILISNFRNQPPMEVWSF